MAEQNASNDAKKDEQVNIAPTVTVTQAPANPLSGYYRQPKIYIRLPSGGKYYPEGALDPSENGDYAVYAMTAKDELMLKTPDALLSGESTVEVIKSCVPAIKQPWMMPTIDIDSILVGIRIATYGDEMDVWANCPECKEENKYTIPLTNYINTGKSEWKDKITTGDLTFDLEPYNYKQMTGANIKTLEEQRVFSIVNDEEMSDQEKMEKFQKSFVRLTNMTIDTIADVVTAIETPQGKTENKDQIRDFLNNCDKEVFQGLTDHLADIKGRQGIPDQHVKCESCAHEWDLPVTMDQANFFADRS
jgi:hypothetical protein|tara:strand:- start:385 stop:1296 length:912 start_codon:yes stop_codon:yes gene_type:complete